MLRLACLCAVVAGVWAGACTPTGRRVNANENVTVVFPGETEGRSQAAGVHVKEFMPSVGPLYVNYVEGSSALYCYAGSPVGYLNADMCCELDENNACPGAGFLQAAGGSVINAIGGIDNLQDDVTVPVKATVCHTPTENKGERSLKRTASQLMQDRPPA